MGQILAQDSVDCFLTDIYANYFIQTLVESRRVLDAQDRLAILVKIQDFYRVSKDFKGTFVI